MLLSNRIVGLVILLSFLFNQNCLAKEDEVKKKYAIAPIIVSNPNIGTGAGVAAMYFYDIGETVTKGPRSFSQVVGAYTSTDSYFGGLINDLHLMEDSMRAKLALFHGSINSEYRDYNTGGQVNFNNSVLALYGQASYKLWPSTYLGVQMVGTDHRYAPDTLGDQDYLDRVGAEDSRTGGIGPTFEYDSRDNTHHPTSGTHIDIKAFYKPENWGNEENYSVVDGAIDHFVQIKENHILALRLFGRTGTENTPYSDKSKLGKRSDLRGFKSGEITALTMLAGQAEYRLQLTERWGVVGFGGLSKLWDNDFDEMITEDLYYSVGAGIRFMINTDQKINFRIDVAVGNDDNQGIYVGIREAF